MRFGVSLIQYNTIQYNISYIVNITTIFLYESSFHFSLNLLRCVQSRAVYCTDEKTNQCRYDTFMCEGFAPVASRTCHVQCKLNCKSMYNRRSCVRDNQCGACLPPYTSVLAIGNSGCMLPSTALIATVKPYNNKNKSYMQKYSFVLFLPSYFCLFCMTLYHLHHIYSPRKARTGLATARRQRTTAVRIINAHH